MATKTVLETLEAARKLISDPAKWTQREYARDSHGKGLILAAFDAAIAKEKEAQHA